MRVEGLILMGVSGCGKSTVAAKLAERLGCGASAPSLSTRRGSRQERGDSGFIF